MQQQAHFGKLFMTAAIVTLSIYVPSSLAWADFVPLKSLHIWHNFSFVYRKNGLPISFMRAVWNVPQKPKEESQQMIAVWPGLETESGLVVLQPVLRWEKGTWYVACHAVEENASRSLVRQDISQSIAVEAGQSLSAVMKLEKQQGSTFTYSCTFEDLPATRLEYRSRFALNSAWIDYETQEIAGCDQYAAGSIRFKNIDVRFGSTHPALHWYMKKEQIRDPYKCGMQLKVLKDSLVDGEIQVGIDNNKSKINIAETFDGKQKSYDEDLSDVSELETVRKSEETLANIDERIGHIACGHRNRWSAALVNSNETIYAPFVDLPKDHPCFFVSSKDQQEIESNPPVAVETSQNTIFSYRLKKSINVTPFKIGAVSMEEAHLYVLVDPYFSDKEVNLDMVYISHCNLNVCRKSPGGLIVKFDGLEAYAIGMLDAQSNPQYFLPWR